VKIVEDGKAAGVFSPRLDTHIAVFGVLGALNWIPEWYSDKGSSSPEEIADRMAESLIFGLREGPAWTESGKDEEPLPAGRTLVARKRAAVSKGRV
jgi:Tetracyclin repressor-like, C-terminal domain